MLKESQGAVTDPHGKRLQRQKVDDMATYLLAVAIVKYGLPLSIQYPVAQPEEEEEERGSEPMSGSVNSSLIV